MVFHGNDNFIGMDIDDPPIDFAKLARSLGLTAKRIEKSGAIAQALRQAISSRRPTLLEVIVERDLVV